MQIFGDFWGFFCKSFVSIKYLQKKSPKFAHKKTKKNYAVIILKKKLDLQHIRVKPFFRFFSEKVFLKKSNLDNYFCPVFKKSK
jgi:hypothetical protein